MNRNKFYWKTLLILCLFYIHQVVAVPANYNWVQRFPNIHPPKLIGASMAFDPKSQRLILFGGGNDQFGQKFQVLNDTWAWNGRNWEKLSPDNRPPARTAAGMALDPVSGQLILFGGCTNVLNPFNDTWTWTGDNWEKLNPLHKPSPRIWPAMATDPNTQQLLLFGGANNILAPSRETWTWNGKDWILLNPPTSPPGLFGSGFSVDSNNRLILFGGLSRWLGPYTAETWAWNGTTWSLLTPADSPSARSFPAMAFDPRSGQVVLFGGEFSSSPPIALNDTWVWNGITWIQQTTQNAPKARSGASFAFDPSEDQLVLFGGGLLANAFALYDDTWLWEPLPTVTSVSPSSGPPSGGTRVIINGSNFSGNSSVQFGSEEAIDVEVISSTEIRATSPPGSLGTVDVRVRTKVGISLISDNDQFTYIDIPLPAIRDISPDSGPIAGGTVVTIRGENFVPNNSTVKFGTQFATNVQVLSTTRIEATSPPSVVPFADVVDVVVTTPAGSSMPADFMYIDIVIPRPIIADIDPNSGSEGGGTLIIIQGANFEDTQRVLFGAVEASSFDVISDSEISAVSPPGTGTVDVRVINLAGESDITPSDQFTYTSALTPQVTAISPSSGPADGGTSVSIFGVNFLGAFNVSFGSTPAEIVSISNTEIVAISPEGSPGSIVDVTVTTPDGTSPVSAADEFTYDDIPPRRLPTIERVSPSVGSINGGDKVTIFGTNLESTIVVFFGQIAAEDVKIKSDEEIVVISPPGAPGTVDIQVTTAFGVSPIVPEDQFTYVISPSSILPPRHLRGFQKITSTKTKTFDLKHLRVKHRFSLTKTNVVNVLTWKANPEGTPAVEYRIYRGKKSNRLIGTVPADQPLKFKDKNIKRGKTYTYSVFAIDALGNASEPATVKIKPIVEEEKGTCCVCECDE